MPFRLAYLEGHTLALEGEVDTFSATDLKRMLRIMLADRDNPTELDLQALAFTDHCGLITLADHSREHPLALVHMSPIARRLCELL